MAPPVALVVEDQENFREFLTVALQRLGFEVVTAITGKVALRRVNEHRINLAVLDVMLPDMDGFAICEALRENPKTDSIPILFCSAVGTEKAQLQALEAGATDYLVKPISLDQLRDVIERHMSLG